MLGKRIVSGIVLIIIIIAAIAVEWIFKCAIMFFIILGLWEFFGMLEKKGIGVFKYFGIVMGAVIPLSIMSRFETTKGWELLFVALGLLFLFMMQFRRRENSGVTVGIATTLFGIIYVAWFMSFLIKIRYLPSGAALLSAVLLITKLGDIGAYFIGKSIGKTPLLPKISPKKSVEGAIGGLIFSIAAALASRPLLGLGYPELILLGFFIGVLGQLGDLSESLIKRDCQVKDSGTILPGMGGILDEIDSLLFTAPVFYFYISTVLK